MSLLEVPGARLYYETHGSGPLMLMVPGAGGAADVFRMMTERLAAQYEVVIYDRRGFSRSQLDGAQDYDHRLQTDADDVRCLIEHLSGDPATLFGGSSGGIVVLDVLARHSSMVGTIVPFEPPAMRVLPDGQEWIDFFFSVYDTYRQSGTEPALKEFRERAFTESDAQAMATAKRTEFGLANATYWFEHELRQYPAVELDLEALQPVADRIVLAVGGESFGNPACEVNVQLGKQLGRDLSQFPGGHAGYITQPIEFASELLKVVQIDSNG